MTKPFYPMLCVTVNVTTTSDDVDCFMLRLFENYPEPALVSARDRKYRENPTSESEHWRLRARDPPNFEYVCQDWFPIPTAEMTRQSFKRPREKKKKTSGTVNEFNIEITSEWRLNRCSCHLDAKEFISDGVSYNGYFQLNLSIGLITVFNTILTSRQTGLK